MPHWKRRASVRDTSPEESFRPYRQLAICVLVRALRDVASANGASADRESARIFLNGSSMLLHWCHVAALDPTVVTSLAEKLAGTSGDWTTRYDEATRAGRPLPVGAIPYATAEFLRMAHRVGPADELDTTHNSKTVTRAVHVAATVRRSSTTTGRFFEMPRAQFGTAQRTGDPVFGQYGSSLVSP